MMSACPIASADTGVIRSLLATTDCNVSAFTEAGYKALAGPQSIFPIALTTLLTIYVALLGYRLLFGRGGAQLSDTPLIALKVGAIMALTLNWSTFQTLVLDVSTKAPLEIGRIVGDAHVDPLQRLQSADDELLADQAAFARLAGSNPLGSRGAEAGAAEGLSDAAAALFWSTAGILAFATIATGVLAAIGPIFIALFLFEVTRGLFMGWIRALLAAALAPMVCWITIVVLLLTLEPWLKALADQRETSTLSVDTATIATALVLVFAAAQAGLILAGGIIASGFHFKSLAPRARDNGAAPQRSVRVSVAEPQSRAQLLAQTLQRWTLSEEGSGRLASGAAVGGGGRGRSRSSGEVSARAVRLGQTYRRGVFRERPIGSRAE